MKRQVITIQEDMVIYAPHHGEVWMTVWEIAELLNVTGTAEMCIRDRYFGVHVHKAFDIGQINREKTIKQAKKLVCVPKQ